MLSESSQTQKATYSMIPFICSGINKTIGTENRSVVIRGCRDGQKWVKVVKRYCCSVAESCLILCHPMDGTTPGSFVLHYTDFTNSVRNII